MQTIKLKGLVLKIIKHGTNQVIVLFRDNCSGKIILSVNRTQKLFYEIKEGMVLSGEASLRGNIDRHGKAHNNLNLESYEILERGCIK